MNHINKIEFSPELEPMLRVFAKKIGADTAILYRFIDIENVVATELLGLLSKSDMVNANPEFYTDVIKDNLNENKKGGIWSLKEIIEKFKKGKLDYKKSINFIEYLKENIRILRFAEYAEKDVDKKIYDFDYTERPQKYLVLSDKILREKYQKKKLQYSVKENSGVRENIESKEEENIKKYVTNQIKYEGVTAYFVRAGDSAYFENKDGDRIRMDKEFVPKTILDANDAHVKNKANKPAYRIYGAHSASWVLLKRKNEKTKVTEVIGCLRFEFSLTLPNNDYEKIKFQLQETFNDITNELFISTVDEVFENYEEFSYSKRYSCLDPIINELIEIGKQLNLDIDGLQHKLEKIESSSPANDTEKKRITDLKKEAERLKEMHSTIEHLFFVFKRNTYYGDKIYLRVNHFITDLLKKLDLPHEVYTKVWDSLKKQEELMLYDLNNYRDHFMHQFHVFIIGYIFIYRYGIEELRVLTSNNYLINGVLDGDWNEKLQESFNKIDVLRIWALTSLFHDCGYSFEKLTNGFKTFTDRTLLADLKIDATWKDFFLKEKTITMKLQTMAGFFKLCPNKKLSFDKTDLMRILLQKGILDNDHGIISALILLQHFDYSNLQEVHHIINIPEESIKLFYLTNIAAISIAVHNNKVYGEMVDQGCSQICFELNPYLFILTYCDTVQEWGRQKSNSENCQVYIPALTKIELKDESGNDIFGVNLKYTVSKSEIGTIESNILKYVNQVSHVFVAPRKRSMKITYEIGDRNCFEVIFANCNLRCKNCISAN